MKHPLKLPGLGVLSIYGRGRPRELEADADGWEAESVGMKSKRVRGRERISCKGQEWRERVARRKGAKKRRSYYEKNEKRENGDKQRYCAVGGNKTSGNGNCQKRFQKRKGGRRNFRIDIDS